MKPDQIIRIILRSRSIMNDISELNDIDKQLYDINNDQKQNEQDIAEMQKWITRGIPIPPMNEHRRYDLQVREGKLSKMKGALEEKLRIKLRCEFSPPEERGVILLDGAKKFYRQFKNNPITDRESYIPRYDVWTIDLLEECLRIGFQDAEVYFLLASIYVDIEKIEEAFDYISGSLDLDDAFIKALELKITIMRMLINEGEDWRKTELLKDQGRLELLSSDISEAES